MTEVVIEHQHTWRKIWTCAEDGRETGTGLKCLSCEQIKWSGKRPDGWETWK